MIERPVAPMLIVRVETDWFVHGTEFRYVLQPGESISATHSLPIGQVFFVPREDIALRDGTEEEVAARRRSSEAFFREKVGVKLKTAYGLEYSPHYLRTSRLQNATSKPQGAGVSASDTGLQAVPGGPSRPFLVQKSAMDPLREPEASAPPKVGRNEACPCGSGKKFKKCCGG